MPTFSPKHILCPVDFDPLATRVLRWASEFAKTYQSHVRVLHAFWIELPRYFTASQEEEFARQAETRKTAVTQRLESMVAGTFAAGIPHEICVADAPAAQAISRDAAARPPDFVILGSHGRSGVERMRLGSVAETVLYESSVPVLIVKAGKEETAAVRVRRVLVPVNFTALDRRSMEAGAGIATAFGARLLALHAQEQGGETLEQAHERLCQWIPKAARSGCEIKEAVRQGNAAEEILRHAQEEDADLIVLGAEHRPLLEITTWGTSTERVIRHSAKPVLVLPWRKK
jgi:nucleotide-binding universal stress UspA family protein